MLPSELSYRSEVIMVHVFITQSVRNRSVYSGGNICVFLGRDVLNRCGDRRPPLPPGPGVCLLQSSSHVRQDKKAGKKEKNLLSGVVYPLTTGDFIRVRRGVSDLLPQPFL